MSSSSSPWPGDCQGAISLTFDDGLASQLALAVPLLNRFDLRGTFYLNPRDGFEQALAPWREVAAFGHELGNHTVSHPCSYNFAFMVESGRRPLEEMTLDEMEAEIVEASRRIRILALQQADISFAYPCYQTFVGRGLTQQSYVPLVARHCIAGRGRGETANDPLRCDLAHVWSWPCERMSGAELVGLAEQAASQGRWGILTFHGVHEGHLPIGERDLAELCAFLARARERIWTAPVATVARRIAQWRLQFD
ncbi:MAG: polysaccharide deacetylase family protein [Anaerolineae bacterium]|nr:polysaccharide deacetylase family protein [Anaerolineae bacterium]MDW8100871.1 polysaccharide deacetylase family protein [Anaerolineae bacterium]